jgi:antitoxin CptB
VPNENLLKRVLYRATYRGGKEADFILKNFAQIHAPTLSKEDLQILDNLLQQDDSDIFSWVEYTQAIPPAFDTKILKLLRNYIKSLIS